MSITMRSGEQPYLDLPPASDQPGRHRIGPRSASYRDLFAIKEFRALWSAQLTSYVGDQIAQVAIAVLVYAKTGSPWLTAIVYALTYLPPIVGGPLLAGLADAFPRRQVMIALDLVRAGLLEIMALPQVPLSWMCILLFAAMLLGPPFSAARSALLPDILPADKVAQGSAAGDITFQASQAAGFLVGGVLVTLLGSYRALALDALTFCISATLLAAWICPRTPPRDAPAHRSPWRQRSPWGQGSPWGQRPRWGQRPPWDRPAPPAIGGEGGTIIFRQPVLRTLVLFGWLAGFVIVPEGVAAPYARTLGGGPVTVGLLMAAMPIGMAVGVPLVSRLARPDEQLRMIGWLAMLSCAPLIASVTRPPLWVLVPLWGLAGAGGTYQLAAVRAFVRAIPAGERKRAFGTAQSGMLTVQGLGIVLAGAATQAIGPQRVVAIAGLLGLTAAAALASDWARQRGALLPGLDDRPGTTG